MDMTDVDSVVLETDGTFSVVHESKDVRESSLRDVPSHPTHEPDKRS
jgi:uncharacterized membrane protein YcaP (DUF421 family)